MVYGTGGAAYGGGNGYLNAFDNLAGLAWHGAPSSTRVGWTIGAGAEYAITDNITLKAEYLYVDLGSSTFSTPAAAFPVASNLAAFNGLYATGKINYDASIFRAGVNYKF